MKNRPRLRFSGAPPCRKARRVRVCVLVGVLVAMMVPAGGAAGAGSVAVSPGQSIQAAVNANPAGTTFVIKAGVHRRQQVIPRDRDSFLGEPGAVLDGEGVTEFAIGAGGVEVTVRGLVIEDYAPRLQEGVIRLGGGAYDWLVEDNEVRHNSGVGIVAGPGWQVRDNYVHHQGQLGIKASGNDILFQGNEVAYNNTDDIDPSWEAGGSKFVHTRNLVIRDNYVHDNQGPGLWTDGNNIDTLYEGNRVVNNYGPGIFHEISYDAVIRNNVVEGNGFGYTGWIDGAGILVGDSPNVEVYGNTVRYNNDGIAGKHDRTGIGRLRALPAEEPVGPRQPDRHERRPDRGGESGRPPGSGVERRLEQPLRPQHLHPRHRRQVLRLGPLVPHHHPMEGRRPGPPRRLGHPDPTGCPDCPAVPARRRLDQGVVDGSGSDGWRRHRRLPDRLPARGRRRLDALRRWCFHRTAGRRDPPDERRALPVPRRRPERYRRRPLVTRPRDDRRCAYPAEEPGGHDRPPARSG